MERTDTFPKGKQRAERQEMVKCRKAEEWKHSHYPYWRIFLLFHGTITALCLLTHGGALVNPLSRLERITDTTGQVNPLQTGKTSIFSVHSHQQSHGAGMSGEADFPGFLVGKLVRKMEVRDLKPSLFPSGDFHAQLLPFPSDKVQDKFLLSHKTGTPSHLQRDCRNRLCAALVHISMCCDVAFALRELYPTARLSWRGPTEPKRS